MVFQDSSYLPSMVVSMNMNHHQELESVGSFHKPLNETTSAEDAGLMDVICARGKHAWNHPGNKNLRELIAQHSQAYDTACNRADRSAVVSDIVQIMKSRGHRFLKPASESPTAAWTQVSENLQREKIGQLLRNSLGARYRSSARAKKQRKKATNPKIYENFQVVLESNAHIQHILRDMATAVQEQRLSDQDMLQVFNAANASLIETFNSDPSLSQRFHANGRALQPDGRTRYVGA